MASLGEVIGPAAPATSSHVFASCGSGKHSTPCLLLGLDPWSHPCSILCPPVWASRLNDVGVRQLGGLVDQIRRAP